MLARVLRSGPILTAAGATGLAVAFSSGSGFRKEAETESKKAKLVYFDIPGRAFTIRAALRHAKVPFEDVRVSFQDLTAMRGPNGANGKVPLGQLPVLELPSGEILCQSAPILRWAARQSDLYPKDINDALLVDEIVESISEIRGKLPDSKDENERKKLREEYVSNALPKYMDYLTRRLEARGGPFFTGKSLTMADLHLGRFVDGIIEKRFDFLSRATFEKWPAVLKHYEAVKAHPVYANEIKAEEEHKKAKKQ